MYLRFLKDALKYGLVKTKIKVKDSIEQFNLKKIIKRAFKEVSKK